MFILFQRTLTLQLALLLILASCSGVKTTTNSGRTVANKQDVLFEPLDLPKVEDDKNLEAEIIKKIKRIDKTLTGDKLAEVVKKLKAYFSFLGLTARDFKKAAVLGDLGQQAETIAGAPVQLANSQEGSGEDEEDKTPSNVKAIQRLFAASSQFLYCPDLRDWECLEKDAPLKSSAKFRKPLKKDLGVPVNAGDSLDMEVFFTQGWDGSPSAKVVDELAKRIREDGTKSVSVAMFGIDDIEGSMKPVYDALAGISQNPEIDLRAVIDVAGFEKKGPWIFSYREPQATGADLTRWMFAPGNTGVGMHTTFQYDGTPNFIKLLNGNITHDDQARVRVEWPTSNIMHNKYVVLESVDGEKSVWSGTANISKNCMGVERNSNMSIYIKNDLIAQSFIDQFNHMYNFDPTVKPKSKLVTPDDTTAGLRVGRFHRNKIPVSHRLFNFDDGTQVRVYFAPTDDAEHRAILPMLYSAQAGDEIRISMFGGTGYEIVRAMQFAVAKGANIRIAFDSKLGHGLYSWIRDAVLNVFMPNPYLDKVARPEGVAPGKISVRISKWEGKNHYKVGSLSRLQANGSYIDEQIIIGSQNWSSGGNETNDENLVAIMNVKESVPSAKAFNHEFDTRLWPGSREAGPRRR